MSSDKEPERYYKLKGHSELMPENLLQNYDDVEAIYVRNDLKDKPDQLRRRDMYEKVALALLTTIDNISCEGIAKYAEMFLEGADKFAKGEK